MSRTKNTEPTPEDNEERETQTVRVSTETARLLHTLAKWHGCDGIGEFCDEYLNGTLREMLQKAVIK